ncbi:DNA polymerase III subunit delta, partial [Succinivibrio sp.]|uniref:DNA polymerase III subunit delta n=1 Tax=Succinivibrio sp. TaxID=2053619 RepID=UPI00386DFEDB
QWISKQAQKHGLSVESDVISFLSLCCEGNLVAVDQFFSIAKISGKTNIDLETAKAYLESSSRYTGFEFSEAVLAPNTQRALNILASLCQTNTNRTQILSMVVSNFDKMLWVMRKLKEPENIQILKSRNFKERAAFFKSYGIVLPSTSDVILRAAQTMPQDFYDYLVTELAQAAKYLQEFDDKKAYQSLQNMAVSVYTSAVRELKKL